MKSRQWLAVAVATAAIVGIAALGFSAKAHRGITTRVEPARTTPTWKAHLERVETLLDSGDRDLAVRTWRDAWIAALSTRDWQPVIVVGDAALRVGEPMPPWSARASARHAYQVALFRARAAGSLDGMLRAAEAFEALGDAEVAREARRMAAAVAP